MEGKGFEMEDVGGGYVTVRTALVKSTCALVAALWR